jgi:hypothetical protein
MLFVRLPRPPSAQTAVARSSCEATARWLPSMTFVPVKEPTIESNGDSVTGAVVKERPPSWEEAMTTRAMTSSGSVLRS